MIGPTLFLLSFKALLRCALYYEAIKKLLNDHSWYTNEITKGVDCMLYIVTEVLLSIAACYGVGRFFIWIQTEHESIEGVECD